MACPATLSDCLKLQDGSAVSTQYSSLNVLFNSILPNVYIAAGLVIFFMILLGGFTIVSSANDTHKIQEGQKIITSAIIGLVVVFASFWIIQLIQVLTGIQITNSSL
ncbi:MAG: hypothetical protein WCL07_02995 [bacterium]